MSETMNLHPCAAIGCPAKISRRLLMCPAHWRRVPKDVQAMVWQHYKDGQEHPDGPAPSLDYYVAADEAVTAIAVLEGRDPSGNYFQATIDEMVATIRNEVLEERRR